METVEIHTKPLFPCVSPKLDRGAIKALTSAMLKMKVGEWVISPTSNRTAVIACNHARYFGIGRFGCYKRPEGIIVERKE